VSRLRWTGGGFVPCPDQGDVRIVDSWLVTDGKARAVDAHLRRFAMACAAQHAVLCAAQHAVPAGRFACAAVARIPAAGRWFPRLELAVADGRPWLQLWLRPAPASRSAIRLWLPPEPDQRVRPRVKGPDLRYLAGLRDAAVQAGADEAVLVSAQGYVLEGGTTSLLWWRGETLCGPPPDAAVLPSVTRAVLLDLAARRGIPVRFEYVSPEELATLPIWAVNALHGVRTGTLVSHRGED
jgi:hypothetical protein